MSTAVKAVQGRKFGFQRAVHTFDMSIVALYRRVKKEGFVTIVLKKYYARFTNVSTQEHKNDLFSIAYS
jgi:hypothetical protein